MKTATRIVLFSLFLAPAAFAGDRSIQEANPSAPMFHTGEPGYSGYCPTNPAYCLDQPYDRWYRPAYQPRRAPKHVYRSHRTRH